MGISSIFGLPVAAGLGESDLTILASGLATYYFGVAFPMFCIGILVRGIRGYRPLVKKRTGNNSVKKVALSWKRTKKTRKISEVEQVMLKCKICEAQNDTKSRYCHYCGYILESSKLTSSEPRDLYLAVNNVRARTLFGNSGTRIDNVLVRRHSVFDQIQVLKAKIADINLLLVNIQKKDIQTKIAAAIARMQELLEALVRVRIEMEFKKFTGNMNAIRKASSTGNVTTTNDRIKEEEIKMRQWASEVQNFYGYNSIRMILAEKISDFDRLKEEVALGLISSILSTTTLLSGEYDNDIGQDLISLEKESERINFELDRIESELSLR